ncbi:MAG: hypothetical protein ACI4LS_03600 [Treponema sp.]
MPTAKPFLRFKTLVMATGHWPAFLINKMKKEMYIENAVKEIDSPEFAHTKQILEVNEIETENGKYKIENIIEHENQVDIFLI